jgi:hypothetical protein
MFFYFIATAIIIAFPGIILFLLGLLHKKPGQWITGVSLILIAILIVVYAFARVINKTTHVINKISSWETRYLQNIKDTAVYVNDDKTHYDTTWENNKMKVKLYKGKDVAGFIKGIDNKLTLIRIRIDKQLKSKGIDVDKIEEYPLKCPKVNLIPLKLSFSENFKGKITLTAFDGKKEIASITTSCSANKWEEKRVEFEFDKTVKLSDIDYCILYDYIP